jgi:hypothetical protein
MQLSRALPPFLLSLLAACSGSSDLAPASDANVVDTTTLYALEGTAITTPSGFSMPDRNPVRTDQTTAFDFAFNIDAAGRPVFLPLAILGLGGSTANPGLFETSTPFDSLLVAARDGFTSDDTVLVTVGRTLVGRSRVVCSTLGVPMYGKFEVLSVDLVERSATLQFMVNINCGYVGLSPGIPEE